MDNPGIISLGDFQITGAGTFTGEWVTGLEGMFEADAFLNFRWGSGGTKIAAYLQTSLDQGTTAIDLLCMTATQVSKVLARRLKPDGNALTPTDGALPDDTIAVGTVLGDRLRVKVVVTGTYGGSTLLSARAAVR